MHITLLTNEYPPYIYGGAGVHVEYLSREMARLEGGSHTVDVRCFGDQNVDDGNLKAHGTGPAPEMPALDPRHRKVFDPLYRNLFTVGALDSTQIVHCHTWYTHFAGCVAARLLGAPLILTTHSLEPHRPWKEEQLGTGYEFTVWLEQTAYRTADGIIAVSKSMKRDVVDLFGVDPDKVEIIFNGIDTREYRPVKNPEIPDKYGLNPAKPYVLFVGRITRQKGLAYLLKAITRFRPGTQVLVCASSPDTEEIAKETNQLMAEAKATSGVDVVWVKDMVPREDIVYLYSQAAVFVCPSIYEPFGIINLEAMACGTPVVASRVGGIPEAVADGETGILVDVNPYANGDPAPRDPDDFAARLGAAVNTLLDDPELRKKMSEKARRRVVEHFGWDVIAAKTLGFYREVRARRGMR